MSKQTEALKLAREFNRYFTSANSVDVPERISVPRDEWREVYEAFREALAERPAQQQVPRAARGDWGAKRKQPAQQQEPVAWLIDNDYTTVFLDIAEAHRNKGANVEPLYTSPPASKPWVGLSTSDLDEIDAPIRERGSATIAEIYRAIEAKLREKNT